MLTIGFFSSKLISFLKRYKLNKVLTFKNKMCSISIPVYERELYGATEEMVLLTEMATQNKLLDFLSKLNIKTASFSPLAEYERNEIHIGGPIANVKVSTYINNFFPNFKWHINQKHRNNYAEEHLSKLYDSTIEIDNNEEGFSYGNENCKLLSYIEKEKDCAILIKLTKEDFKNGHNKTVHMLFGGGFSGTYAAVNYFINNYNEIYKKFKDKHYFIAFLVNVKDGSIDSKEGMKDLTFEMFKQSN